MKIHEKILFHWRNRNTYKSDRKIVVFESDDWGSIRMPSKEIYDQLIAKGYRLERRPFERYDSLETHHDLQALFNILSSFKDKNDRSPMFTANVIMTNPNFEQIKQADFENYFSEIFTETLTRCHGGSMTFNKMLEGFRKNLFVPQFHGTEHWNVKEWMHALKSGDREILMAFDLKMVGIPRLNKEEQGNRLLIPFSSGHPEDIEQYGKSISKGLALFEQVFGFKSKSFIAPVYTWNAGLEPYLSDNHIEFIQGGMVQRSPNERNRTDNVYHFTGQFSRAGLLYLVRNVYFEPATQIKKIVQSTFEHVKRNLNAGFPVIISTHRLNYISSIDPANRDRSLAQLSELLRAILQEWDDIEFMSTVQLGELIKSNQRD
jgi:hypothetical protein